MAKVAVLSDVHGNPVALAAVRKAIKSARPDAILVAGARPFVELGFMPRGLATQTETLFWWKAHCSPPKEMRSMYQPSGAPTLTSEPMRKRRSTVLPAQALPPPADS